MKDFWLSCGHHLLDRDAGGGLVVTDEFLKVYLARTELTPPPEACVVEKTLHATLMIDPRQAVEAETIAGASNTPTSPLVSMLGIPAEAEIDVMSDDSAGHYFKHSDLFHVALDLTAGRRGVVALAEAMRRWIAHVLNVEVTIEPLTEL